jgi:hypothetical protein
MKRAPTTITVSWHNKSIPLMIDPKRCYQDHCMLEYWKTQDGQENHEEVYQGSSTYMMQQVGNLRYCSMRQRARKVKLMLDWGVYGRRMKIMRLNESVWRKRHGCTLLPVYGQPKSQKRGKHHLHHDRSEVHQREHDKCRGLDHQNYRSCGDSD